MSGHNKWSKIKRKKGVNDAKRSKIWTKIIKDITIAVKDGDAEPESNPKLRLAINNAKGANMPKDTVQRAINKAGESGGANYQETTYEGYGPGGIGIFVECTTDNINRTVANVRMHFSKNGGNLGTNGSLSFLFDRKGIFAIPKKNLNEDDFTLEMIDAGAEDVELEDQSFTVTCAFEDFGAFQKKLETLGIESESAALERVPKSFSAVDLDTAKKVLKLVEDLEDDDDVQAVYHNMEMTEELEEIV